MLRVSLLVVARTAVSRVATRRTRPTSRHARRSRHESRHISRSVSGALSLVRAVALRSRLPTWIRSWGVVKALSGSVRGWQGSRVAVNNYPENLTLTAGYYVIAQKTNNVVQIVGGNVISTLATCDRLTDAGLIAKLLNHYEKNWNVRDVLAICR